MSNRSDITALLQRWRTGSADAESELFALVMPDLRRLARYLMKRERGGHTLQPTELVDEVYFRLVDAKDRDWQNRSHFFAIAGRAMRRHLIDHARGRQNGVVGLNDAGIHRPDGSRKLHLALTLDSLLEEMSAVHPEWCSVVELKFFLGLTDEEAADALGLKLRTLQRMWLEARRWLFSRMESAGVAQKAGR